MKKQNYFKPLGFFAILTLLAACKGANSVAPASERIAKVWTASVVKHGATTVYTKGSNSTVAGYANFKLNLSSAASATLTEFDGTTFTGQWEISADEKNLTLRNLLPQPTGTNGTIAYSISLLEDTKLNLVRISTSSKTGSTINDYALVNL